MLRNQQADQDIKSLPLGFRSRVGILNATSPTLLDDVAALVVTSPHPDNLPAAASIVVSFCKDGTGRRENAVRYRGKIPLVSNVTLRSSTVAEHHYASESLAAKRIKKPVNRTIYGALRQLIDLVRRI